MTQEDKEKILSNGFELKDNECLFINHQGQIFIPDKTYKEDSDDNPRVLVMQQFHDSFDAGHIGADKMLELITGVAYVKTCIFTATHVQTARKLKPFWLNPSVS